MRDLIKSIAMTLVDYPEKVDVSEITGTKTFVIESKVTGEDMGKVIGKEGKTTKAMRTILSAASSKLHKKAVLEIIE